MQTGGSLPKYQVGTPASNIDQHGNPIEDDPTPNGGWKGDVNKKQLMLTDGIKYSFNDLLSKGYTLETIIRNWNLDTKPEPVTIAKSVEGFEQRPIAETPINQPSTRGEAFRQARANGEKIFTFQGKQYTTELASDKPTVQTQPSVSPIVPTIPEPYNSPYMKPYENMSKEELKKHIKSNWTRSEPYVENRLFGRMTYSRNSTIEEHTKMGFKPDHERILYGELHPWLGSTETYVLEKNGQNAKAVTHLEDFKEGPNQFDPLKAKEANDVFSSMQYMEEDELRKAAGQLDSIYAVSPKYKPLSLYDQAKIAAREVDLFSGFGTFNRGRSSESTTTTESASEPTESRTITFQNGGIRGGKGRKPMMQLAGSLTAYDKTGFFSAEEKQSMFHNKPNQRYVPQGSPQDEAALSKLADPFKPEGSWKAQSTYNLDASGAMDHVAQGGYMYQFENPEYHIGKPKMVYKHGGVHDPTTEEYIPSTAYNAGPAWGHMLPEVVKEDKLPLTNQAYMGKLKTTNPIAYAATSAQNEAGNTLMDVTSMMPGIGDVQDVMELVRAIKDKDYRTLGIAAAATAIPFVGYGAFKQGKKLWGNVRNFDNYVSQEEAARLRAERMLSQQDKWVGQDVNTVNKFETAVQRHNPSDPTISKGSLGKNRGGSTGISSEADLNDANKARITSHEVGHYYRNAEEEANSWNRLFDFSKEKSRTARYLRGKSGARPNPGQVTESTSTFKMDKRSPHGDELRERAAQLKDYIAFKNNIHLNKDFTITPAQLNDALKAYVSDTKLDNNMTSFIRGLKDKKGLLNQMNTRPLSIAPIVGSSILLNSQKEKTLPKRQNGGALPKYQDGGQPTKLDSLNLLQNNKVLDQLIKKGGFKLLEDQGFNDSDRTGGDPYSQEALSGRDPGRKGLIDALRQEKINDDETSPPVTKGNLVGARDWWSGGGDDSGFPITYRHRYIKPTGEAELRKPRGGFLNLTDDYVHMYTYDDLAITPWDMLSESQRDERIKKFGISGSPYKTKADAIFRDQTPKPSSAIIPKPAVKNVEAEKDPNQDLVLPTNADPNRTLIVQGRNYSGGSPEPITQQNMFEVADSETTFEGSPIRRRMATSKMEYEEKPAWFIAKRKLEEEIKRMKQYAKPKDTGRLFTAHENLAKESKQTRDLPKQQNGGLPKYQEGTKTKIIAEAYKSHNISYTERNHNK